MDTSIFRYVLEVEKYRNITQAAKRLFISQPALTKQLNKLEKELGFSPFDRTHSPISVTPQGEIFLDFARRYVQLESEMMDSLRQFNQIPAEPVLIATTHRGGAYAAVQAAPFMMTHPEIHLSYLNRNSQQCEEELESESIDLAIYTEPVHSENIEYMPVQEDPLVFVIPQESPILEDLDISDNSLEHPVEIDISRFRNPSLRGSTGFLDLYILVLITGSVLSVDRKMLIKSFAGFVPTILAGIAGALGLAGLVGAITGVGAIEAIATYAIPVMGGGNGAGITPMSKMWAAATGGDASSWYASAFAIISIGNLCAVFMSALLNKLGQIKPSMTGNGRLMVGEENASTKSSDVKLTAADYATGLALGVVCFNVANLYAKHISIINHANLGFSIHTFAFMVILMAILNMTNILPENVKAGARGMQQFFVKYMSFPLMITVGIGTNLTDYAKVFTNPAYIVIIMATVIGAMIGTFIVGKLFHFYPVEGMLTAGLCMANGGGAGDVQCLGAAHRMELMSYAQISSRIGGAIMLVIASFIFGKFL